MAIQFSAYKNLPLGKWDIVCSLCVVSYCSHRNAPHGTFILLHILKMLALK